MSFNTLVSRIAYSGNGSTTAFSFPYYFLASADLVVISKNDTTGVETTKILTTDYTVVGAGVAAGGTVTMLAAPATGTTLTLFRDPAATQGVDLRENDSFPAETIETALDRLTMISQRLQDRVDRSLNLTDGFAAVFDPTLPPLLSPGSTIVINADADGFEEGPTAGDIAGAEAQAAAAAASATAAATSASDANTSANDALDSATNAAFSAAEAALSTATISPFMATVLDDPDAVSARATLGAAPVGGTGARAFDNGTIGASVASSALTISLKDVLGNNPSSSSKVFIGFRSSTLSSGLYLMREVSAALSLTISSGATLGHISGVNQYIYVYALDNAGTVQLAVSATRLDEGVLQDAFAMSAAATVETALYSVANLTGKAIRLLGVLTSNQTTAGTWAAVPTAISLYPAGALPRQVVIGTPQTANGTVTSPSYAAFSNSVTVSITHTYAGTFKVYGNVCTIHTAAASGMFLKIAATSGSPTATLFNQSTTVNEPGIGYDSFASPFVIYTAAAGSSVTWTLQGKVSSGTMTLQCADVDNGFALVVEQLS